MFRGFLTTELRQNSDFSKFILAAIECAPQNEPSWKVMERVGLKREAHFRQNVSFRADEKGNPIYWDTYVYAALNPNKDDENPGSTLGELSPAGD